MKTFFDHQDAAKRRTWLLVLLLALAIAVITVVVYPVFALIVAWLGPHGGFGDRDPDWARMWEMMWRWDVFVATCAGVLVLVLGGALMKTIELSRAGGDKVARMLGGKRVDPDTNNPNRRKLMNVVEEMAIASGIGVPNVYVLPGEGAINAFAAGTTVDNAVVGVTRGAIEQLSRDELQGVIAHEFSHILNGDSRVNIRLIGVAHGLLLLGVLGQGMMRGALYGSVGRRRYSSRSGRGGGGGVFVLLAMGLVLIVVGSLGVLFARMIKAAVSRQREYLADAAAVQYTRNPSGLAGALKKIGGFEFGSRISAAKAEEASHMFFGRGMRFALLLDTHPPLPRRIKQIDPHWDGVFPKVELSEEAKQRIAAKHEKLSKPGPGAAIPGAAMGGGAMPGGEAGQAAAGAVGAAVIAGAAGAGGAGGATATAGASATAQPLTGRRLVERIGQPTAEHVEQARRLRESIPEEIKEAVHKPGGARAVVYALLLTPDEEARREQASHLKEHAHPAAYELTRRYAASIHALGGELRLPLLDLALPVLKRLGREDYERFRANAVALIDASGRVTAFEWMLRRLLLHRLDPVFRKVKRPRTRYYSLKPLADSCAMVLATLAHLGGQGGEATEPAKMYQAGAAMLPMELPPLLEPDACKLDKLDAALDRLLETSQREQRRMIAAAATCIAANDRITPRELEMLRALSDTFGAPMPPLSTVEG